ncbi:acyl-CoA thioester hydrolase/BAAT C-terminal domain-containing protein [Gynurincola endophyticus]|uniref:acyl-CoA thioester hydrolase/BAAT C-terminal domain-containing protein n=1 Tax=Gynurincola endophyticus TaxID=2479004 RepID=UPI000F8E2ABA|nr:acyl-CoA thioester hydrolase/BAAT C-terminal domain-containing protein [Gynurincola endophyticus]
MKLLTKKQLLTALLLSFITSVGFAQHILPAANVEAILYTGNTENQPLVVGLGGSEGGNAWAGDHWKKVRDGFLERGYAFLAIGYFGCKETPELLDKIAIEDVYRAVGIAKKYEKIDSSKIIIIGGSRGADLALLIGSYYKDISAVIGMSASHAVFPGHTQEFNTSCWTFGGEELPFIPVNEEAIPFLMNRDLRGAFEAMLKDTLAEQKAIIKIEKINGSILLLSAIEDEIIPAVTMGEKMILRLKNNHFKHLYKHIIYKGNHAEPTKHFDIIFDFLESIR